MDVAIKNERRVALIAHGPFSEADEPRRLPGVSSSSSSICLSVHSTHVALPRSAPPPADGAYFNEAKTIFF